MPRRRARLAIASLALAACDAALPGPLPSLGAVTPMRGGSLELAMLGDVRTLDPARMTSGVDAAVGVNLYAGLVDVDREGRLVPVLAERIELDDDGRTIRMHLRAGVLFHDGAPLDAHAIVASLRRIIDPATESTAASLFAKLRGFEAFRSGASDELPGLVPEGPLSLRFELTEYDATFLPSLTLVQARPVCPSSIERTADEFVPCGAGPFRLDLGAWTRGESLTLSRFEGYFRAPYPLVDAIHWRLQTSSRSQQILFSRGDIHVTRDLLAHDAKRYLADARWSALREREAATTFWGESMNVEMPPFDNVEVRRAVAAAIDRRLVVALDPTRLRASTGPLPPGAAGFDAALECQRFDRDAALEHMRRAGFSYDPVTRQGGIPTPVPYLATARTFAERSAQVLQAQLAQVGIRLEPRLVSYTAYLAATHRRHAVTMAPTGWSQDFPDPSNFFDALYASSSIDENDAVNTSFYANRDLDDLLQAAHRERDEGSRATLFRRASRIVCDDAPIAFTHVPEAVVLRQAFVRDFVTHPVWLHDLERVWLARSPATRAPTPVGPSVPKAPGARR
jgi:ABC-type transport system substrate-binding protein